MRALVVAAGLLLGATISAATRDTAPSAEIVFAGCTVPGTRSPTEFDCTYRLSWADDGNGPIDSIDIVDQVLTPSPGPLQALGLGGQPTSPRTLTIHRPRPAPNTSLSGSVQAKLIRRGLAGPIGVRSWAYTEPDVPPPPVTIDTTLQVEAFWVEPIRPDSVVNGLRWWSIAVTDTVELCAFVRFRGGAVGRYPKGGALSANCTARWNGYKAASPPLSVAQAAIVDTMRHQWVAVPRPGSALAVLNATSHGGGWRYRIMGAPAP